MKRGCVNGTFMFEGPRAPSPMFLYMYLLELVCFLFECFSFSCVLCLSRGFSLSSSFFPSSSLFSLLLLSHLFAPFLVVATIFLSLIICPLGRWIRGRDSQNGKEDSAEDSFYLFFFSNVCLPTNYSVVLVDISFFNVAIVTLIIRLCESLLLYSYHFSFRRPKERWVDVVTCARLFLFLTIRLVG